MFRRHARDLLPLLRRALLCGIVLALVIQGSTAALVQMLGPSHRHEVPGLTAGEGLLDRIDHAFRDIRAWRAELRQEWLPSERPHAHADGTMHTHGHGESAAASTEHTHAHTLFQRHHHRQGDHTVIAADAAGGEAAADASAQAGAGSITLPLALAGSWAVPPPAVQAMAWPRMAALRWSDAPLRSSERPPRA